jgi:hypothetical protein
MVAAALAAVQGTVLGPWPVKEEASALNLLQQPRQSSAPSSGTFITTAVVSPRPPRAPPTALPLCGAAEFVLDNGLVVCVKRTPRFKKGQVAFQAFCLGGSSELTEAQEAAFSLVDDVADGSGLGFIGHEELRDLKAATSVRVNTQRHLYHRGVGGSAPSSRLPELLTMLALKLTPGRQPFRAEALAKAVAVQQEGLRHRDRQPEFKLLERARVLCHGDVSLKALRPMCMTLTSPTSPVDLPPLPSACRGLPVVSVNRSAARVWAFDST